MNKVFLFLLIALINYSSRMFFSFDKTFIGNGLQKNEKKCKIEMK